MVEAERLQQVIVSTAEVERLQQVQCLWLKQRDYSKYSDRNKQRDYSKYSDRNKQRDYSRCSVHN